MPGAHVGLLREKTTFRPALEKMPLLGSGAGGGVGFGVTQASTGDTVSL